MVDGELKIYCDGGARGNPGPAASAFLVIDNGKILREDSKYIGKATNNVAEYTAVLMAIKWLEKNKIYNKEFLFFLDSKLIANQLSGNYKVKNVILIKFHREIKDIENVFNFNISYNFIPREDNAKADALVNSKLSTKFTLSRTRR